MDPNNVIKCGNSHFDPNVEARFQAIRERKGDTDIEGCGGTLHWSWAYRCLDCARWMHGGCLKRHFAKHGDKYEIFRQQARRALEKITEALETTDLQNAPRGSAKIQSAVDDLSAALGEAEADAQAQGAGQ